jgi:flagellar secretion chaperone FliS
MTARNNPWQSYRKVATQTATPGQLVLMLYDGAIGFLERGLVGFAQTDPLEFNLTINNNILRAQAIINEINSRLDMERGGEIAANFRRLYNYLLVRLNEANRKKKREPLDEVLTHLRGLRDSWAEMLRQGQGNFRPTEEMLAQEKLQAA